MIGYPGRARFMTAFNAGLTWRQVDKHLPPADRQRMRKLVG